MSVQSGTETLNHLDSIEDQLSINTEPTLRSSFKEKTDSLQKSTHSVTFENPTQETIRRNARKLLASSNQSMVNVLLLNEASFNNQKKENPKRASKTVQRSLSDEPVPVSKVIKRSVKFENIQSTPKIGLNKEEKEYTNSEPISGQNNDFLHEKQTTFLSSNATSVILVLIFIVFTKLFL